MLRLQNEVGRWGRWGGGGVWVDGRWWLWGQCCLGRGVGGGEEEGWSVFKEVGKRFTNLCHGQILRVLLSACGGEEDDVVNGLDELQLHHTANQQPLEQLLVRGLDF